MNLLFLFKISTCSVSLSHTYSTHTCIQILLSSGFIMNLVNFNILLIQLKNKNKTGMISL